MKKVFSILICMFLMTVNTVTLKAEEIGDELEGVVLIQSSLKEDDSIDISDAYHIDDEDKTVHVYLSIGNNEDGIACLDFSSIYDSDVLEYTGIRIMDDFSGDLEVYGNDRDSEEQLLRNAENKTYVKVITDLKDNESVNFNGNGCVYEISYKIKDGVYFERSEIEFEVDDCYRVLEGQDDPEEAATSDINSITVEMEKVDPQYNLADLIPSQEYTGEDIPVMNSLSTVTGGTLEFAVTEHGISPTEDDYSTSIPTVKEVGNYDVYYKITGDTGYKNIEETKYGEVNIRTIQYIISVTQDKNKDLLIEMRNAADAEAVMDNSEIDVYSSKSGEEDEYLYHMSYSSNYSEYGYYPSESYTLYNSKYIKIPYAAILANNLKADEAKVVIRFEVQGEEVEASKEFTLATGAATPKDFTVKEDENGNIQITSSDVDFIKAIAKAYRATEDATFGEAYYIGSRIDIVDGTCTFMNYETEDGSSTPIVVTATKKSATATIANKYVLSEGLLSNEDDENYTLRICAYGYIPVEKTIHIEHGCKRVDEPCTATVEDGNLIIRSDNDEFLRAMTQRFVYDENGNVISEGCRVEFMPIHGGGKNQDVSNFYIENSEYTSDDGGTVEEISFLYVEAQGEEASYVIIPEEILKYNHVPNVDGCMLAIYIYGYEDVMCTAGFNLSGYYNELPEDIEIYQDTETYDIYIGSSDKDYIDALLTPTFDSTDWELINCNSTVTFSGSDGNVVFYIEQYGEDIYSSFSREEENGKYYAVLDYEGAIKENLKIGDYSVEIFVNGYDEKSLEFNIHTGIKPAPEVTFSMNNLDLVITVADEDYIGIFNSAKDDEYGSISLSKGDYTVYIEEPVINEEENQIIVSNADLRLYGITGTYEITLNASGYESISKDFNIANKLTAVPKDLSVKQDKSGNLLITTKDKSYLKALMKTGTLDDGQTLYSYVTQYDDDNNRYGGVISNLNYPQEGKTVNRMSLSGKTITIKKDVLMESYWVNCSSGVVELHADGYACVRKSNMKLTGLCSIEQPETFEASYEQGVGIKIKCDAFYLKGMVDNDSDKFDKSSITLAYGSEEEDYLDIIAFGNYKEGSSYYKYFDVKDNTLTIPESVLVFNEIDGSTVRNIRLRSYGFVYTCGDSVVIEVPELVKTVPVISAAFNKDGDFVIEAQEDYLKALAKSGNLKNGAAGEFIGGAICICKNDDEGTLVNTLENGAYEIKDGKITIDSSTFRKGIRESGQYVIVFEAAGYEIYTETEEIYVLKGTDENFNGKLASGKEAQFEVENYTENITWEVDDLTKAEIDESGKLLGLKVGTVKVIAKDEAGNVIDQTSVTITEYVPNGKITVKIPDISQGFETGDTPSLQVYDNGILCNAKLFDYVSSSSKLVTVDSTGTLTGIAKGSATITVYYGGTKKKAASIKTTITDRQINAMTLSVQDYTETENGVYLDENVKSIQLVTSCIDKLGQPFNATGISYTVSDSALASIDKKTGKLTIKKAGQFTVTATTTTNAKSRGQVSDSIIIRVVDYTPVLESDKITLNRYLNDGVKVSIHTKYDSEVISAELIPTGRFSCTLNDGVLSVKAADPDLKNGSYNEKLAVTVKDPDGNTHDYSLSVKITVTSSVPSLSLKSSGTYNTFTKESTLKITESSYRNSSTPVESIVFSESSDGSNLWAEMDMETGEVSQNTKTSGTYWVIYEGYNTPYKGKITFKTVSTSPKYKLDASSAVIYHTSDMASETEELTVHVLDTDGSILEVKKSEISVYSVNGKTKDSYSGYNVDEEGNISLTVGSTKASSYEIRYQKTDWNKYLSFSFKTTVSSKLPSTKLADSTLTLNRYFCWETKTLISTSSANEPVTKIDYAMTDTKKASSYPDVEFVLENGYLTARYSEADGSETHLKAGSYRYTVTPHITVNGKDVKLKAVTVTLKVTDTIPQAVYKTASYKVNVQAPGETFETVLSHKNTAEGFAPEETVITWYNSKTKEYVPVDENTYNLVIDTDLKGETNPVLQFVSGNSTTGKVDYYISETYSTLSKDEAGNAVTVEGPKTKISVTFYSKTPSVSVSISGSLNPLDLSQSASGTFKYSNIAGTVTAAQVTDYDEFFNAEIIDGKLVLLLKDAAQARTFKDGTYKVPVTLKVSNLNGTKLKEIKTTVSLKVARKAPSVKLSQSTVNVYDTSGLNREVARVKLNGLSEATVAEFWSQDSLGYRLELDEETNEIVVILKDASQVKSGSTTKISFKLDWTGDLGTYSQKTKNIKTSTFTLSIKDCSSK